MRVGIIGSRRRTDQATVAQYVQGLPPDTTVVSGGCSGPDTYAADAARARGLTVVEHLPDLAGCKQRHEHTRRYYERNQRIVDDVDQLAAFVAPDRRGGTEHTIKCAKAAGKPVLIL